MDPLNCAVQMKRRVNFLANASMFATPFTNWFFSTFYCIKIERYTDTGGKPIDNKKAFKMAADYLKGGGRLYMAPEGGSYPGRRLNRLKTGPARIALNTELANDFKLGLVILPIGLNYTDPGKFRGGIHTVMGKPIRVADFKKDWEVDEREAVRKLTDHLRERMEEILIDTADEIEEGVLEKAESILQSEKALAGHEKFLQSKAVLEKLQFLKKTQQNIYANLKDKTAHYFQQLQFFHFNDQAVKGGKKVSFFQILLVSPFFFLGWLIHFLPAFLIKKLSDTLTNDQVWIPTYKTLGGVIIYPLVLFLQFWLLKQAVSSFWEMPNWFYWIYCLSIIPLGLVAEWFIGKWCLFKANTNYQLFSKQRPKEAAALVKMREEILAAVCS